MSLTFPYSAATFADLLRMAPGTSWSLSRNDQLSGVGTGQTLAAELASPLWTADVQTPEISNADARKIMALAEALQGPINSFYLYDPLCAYPANDPDGSILAAATPTINALNANNKALKIDGLPVDFVIEAGDMFAFDYGSSPARRALHKAAEAAAVDGSGVSAEFEVSTYFRTGVATGLPVTMLKPAAKVYIVPKTLKIATMSAVTSQITMTVMQKI